MTISYRWLILGLIVVLPCQASILSAQVSTDPSLATCFSYHGALKQDGAAAEGVFDFEFELYDLPEGGELLGHRARYDHVVSAGNLTAKLDFDRRIDPTARWLEIHVRKAGGGPFTVLTPRQNLKAAKTHTVAGDLVVEGNIETAGTRTGFLDANGNETVGIGWIPYGSSNEDVMTLRTSGTDQIFISASSNLGIGRFTKVPLKVVGGTDASISGTSGYAVIGEILDDNVLFDTNEIMARNNGATSSLHLNNDGGDVNFGGDLTVGGSLSVGGDLIGEIPYGYTRVWEQATAGNQALAVCPSGMKVIGGGCSISTNSSEFYLVKSEATTTGWYCMYYYDHTGDPYHTITSRAHCVE